MEYRIYGLALYSRSFGRSRELDSEAVVAFKKRLHPVRRHSVFGVEPFGSVTFAAHLFGDFSGAAFQPFNFVLRMAIGAGGRFAQAFGRCPTVNTGLEIGGLLRVALAAGGREP